MSRDRFDRLLPEDLAERGNLYRQIVLLDHRSGPDQVQQFVLGDQPIAPFNQRQQHIERTRAQRRRSPVDQELTCGRNQLKTTESVDSSHVGSSGVVSTSSRTKSILLQAA